LAIKFLPLLVLAGLVVLASAQQTRATHTCRKLPAVCDENPQEARRRPECRRRVPVHRIDEADSRFDAKACAWAKDNLEIVSGNEPPPGTFGETVLIMPPQGTQPICSGVLIASRVVLTARHCLKRDAPIATQGSRVVFGDHASTDPAAVRLVDAPPAVPPTQLANLYPDVILLRLNAPAPSKPIAIATSQRIKDAVAVRAVGFGDTGKTAGGRKLYGNLIAVSNACEGTVQGKTDSQYYGCKAGGELVAAGIPPPGTQRPTDTCFGDSGGPIFVVHPSEGATSKTFDDAMLAGRYFLAGTTARGTGGLPCGGAGIYTLTAGDTLTWIQRTAGAWGQRVQVAP
jgi:hypothetical protein